MMKRNIQHILFTLLLLVAGMEAWGQTDYSGTYYIASVGYNPANTETNYYLCPTEGWCYYKATNDFWPSNTEEGNKTMPFLTTYQCRSAAYHSGDASDAVWYVEKHPTLNYYYIKQASTGRYLTSNGQISNAGKDRMRVHLESVAPEDLDDKELFTIAEYSTYLTISPKGVVGGAADRTWLTVNGGNMSSLKGESGKTGGPTGYINTAGIIGVYSQNDANAPFYLEPAISIDIPVITNNYTAENTFTITAATGATIYYTTDGTTPTASNYTGTGTTSVTFDQTKSMTCIKAIAKATSDPFPTIVTTYEIPVCAKPAISVSGGNVTITCATEGATIYYTTNGAPATTSSTKYSSPFAKGDISTIRAVATSPGYIISSEAILQPTIEVFSSEEITDMTGNYILAESFSASSTIGSPSNPFKGTIDGNYNAFSLSHALIDVADGATIKNIIVSSATISGSDNAGAIVNTAKGETKIYNCGVLSGSISGSGAVGGLVGYISETGTRVVNCYNYAAVSGGTYAGGIVGRNNGTIGDTRIAMCMMYGNLSGGSIASSPVYAGTHVSNAGNFTEYNYWRSKADVSYSAYNDQLAIDKDDYLTRFPFYRHILNTHRELAAYFLFGDYNPEHVEEIGHWVQKKGDDAPIYPIVEAWRENTKKATVDIKDNLPLTTDDYKGKLLTDMGTNGYLRVNVTINGSQFSSDLPITDMDTLRYDYTWGKIVLPFANEYSGWTRDYDYVCTGWKITSITGGTAGSLSNYNFADRDCTAKDLYANSDYIFAQGGNYIVPYGVTAINIEANFARAYYLSDPSYEMGYNDTFNTATQLGGSVPNTYHDKNVYTNLSTLVGALSTSTNPHSQAIVLVGNYHYNTNLGGTGLNTGKAVTIMSTDEDNNQEPDYGWYTCNTTGRLEVPALRFDFVPNIEMGMSSRVGYSYYPAIGIWHARGWFELTETCVSQMFQCEINSYDFTNTDNGKGNNRWIANSGIFTQIVRARDGNCTKLSYIQIGGNAYVKELYPGSHTDNARTCAAVPILVTGGQVDECYMTGYNASAKLSGDTIYFWCAGGKIDKFLGAYLEEPLAAGITAKADHALINRFFGGGTSSAARIKGNINVTINNSKVNFYCGGPEFGDMYDGKQVATNANNTVFGEYYGAGFGGTSITYKREQQVNPIEIGANPTTTYPISFSTYYKRLTDDTNLGVGSSYKFEYIYNSNGRQGVARFYTGYAQFSLATTGNVTNTLTNCKMTRFYGAGCQGKVSGNVVSTLTDCTVTESAFGAGYKAVSNDVYVYTTTQPTYSVYTRETGIFSDFGTVEPEKWKWAQGTAETRVIDAEHKTIYTTNKITIADLGIVTGNVAFTLNSTTVGESVYGGGEESGVNGNTTVNVNGGTIGTTGMGGATWGNVYGGGKGKANDVNAGLVKGNTNVTISGSPAILHNVYGGGAFGSVGTFTYDSTTGFPNGLTNDTGTANVTIKGGTFGSNGKDNGMVFGSSRGSEGDPEAPDSYVNKIAWVGNTNVIIGDTNEETSPSIMGSVYGGGENGHNYKDATVTIHKGTIGIAEGSPITDDGGTPDDPSDDITYSGARYPSRGNVYGSGCGTDTYKKTVSEVEKTYYNFHAGVVQGNTTVTIDGGHVVHNVYGGGAMGSVGTFTLDENGKPTSCAANTGTCTVTVSGGQIGVAGAKMARYGKGGPDDYGHVFGAGRGEMHDPVQYPNLETCAYFNKAILNISGTAFLTGSAYGGSESGHVLGDTEVNISGGQIGCGKNATEPYGDGVWADGYVPSDDLECESWPYEAPYAPHDLYANATGDVDKYPSGKSTEGGRLEASDGHTYYGNVFGGGSGCVPYYDTTEGISKYLSTAGSVEGKTTVNISGGHILTNVYGGCEATNVKGSATVTMTGGTVGVPRTFSQIVAHPVTCYVFGAGKGDQRIFFNKETNVDHATVTVEGGKVYGSVFGGGEDGHVFQNTTVTIGKTGKEGPTIGTLGTSYVDGNVFGGGRGFSGDALTAGNVGGSVELNIESGKILGSVYGGGRLASVGYGLYLVDEEIEEDGHKIKPYGILRPNNKYDGSYPNPSTESASTYYNNGRGYITINISGGTIGNDNEYIYNPTAEQKAVIPNTTFDYQNHLQYTKGGNVFTGGMGRLYALDGTLLPLWPKLGKCKGTTLNMTGGTVKSSIYGGGEIGAVAENATVNINGGTVGTKVVDSEDATKYYYFGSVFGGGKGSVDNVDDISEAGTTGGNVQVNLNETHKENGEAKGAIVHQVFGCNDMNGSPKGNVTVHVYATQNADKDNISSKYDKGTEKYDVEAVYGGGNLAAYEPDTTRSTKVIIDGCGLTSVRQVYGGGNAASTPATNVEVNGTYEILELFGGGNGLDNLPDGRPNPGANVGYKNYTIYEKDGDNWIAKDDPAYDTKEERTAEGSGITYGTGQASINVFGGTIHRVFGGSNTKGNVRQTAVTLLDENGGCEFCVDEAYGGGKSAPMDAEAKLLMACIPGLQAAYGGAEAAAIKGNVTLNITNGTFDRVFGGNNLSGTIDGSITVNIQEVGCRPIIIGELYGGGNQAAYSVYGYDANGEAQESGTQLYDDPQVNVMSFTSIGKVFGGGYGSGAKMVGNPTVNVNEVYGKWYNDNTSVVGEDAKTPGDYPIPSHAKGKMGAIHTVFGGGNAAKVKGNTTVNIGTTVGEDIYMQIPVKAGDTLPADCYTKSDDTYTSVSGTAAADTTYYKKYTVLGVDIRDNVYGGGDAAEVTGDTKVNIGRKSE